MNPKKNEMLADGYYYPTLFHMPTGLEILYNEPDHQAKCPTCRQQTFLRPVQITKAGIESLMLIRNRPGSSAIPREIKPLGTTAFSTYTQMKYWDFIRQIETQRGKEWAITNVGEAFLDGKIRVPEVLWIYNDHARTVPNDMFKRWLYIHEVPKYSEIHRDTVRAQMIGIDASNNSRLDI